MYMVLTGATITAKEAEAAGLVAFVYPDNKVVEEAIKTGKTDNSQVDHSRPTTLEHPSPIHCKLVEPYHCDGEGIRQPR